MFKALGKLFVTICRIVAATHEAHVSYQRLVTNLKAARSSK